MEFDSKSLDRLDRAMRKFTDLTPDVTVRLIRLFLAVAREPDESTKFYQDRLGFDRNTASRNLRILACDDPRKDSERTKHAPLDPAKALLRQGKDGKETTYSLSRVGVMLLNSLIPKT